MTPTTIALLRQAADYGLRLGCEPPDTVTVEPARLCPPEFASLLKAHKPALLALLRLPFVMVFSEVLDQMVFFTENEDSKDALVEAGVDEWSIYTRDEIRILVAQNRIAPLSAADLRKLHEIRLGFKGTPR